VASSLEMLSGRRKKDYAAESAAHAIANVFAGLSAGTLCLSGSAPKRATCRGATGQPCGV